MTFHCTPPGLGWRPTTKSRPEALSVPRNCEEVTAGPAPWPGEIPWDRPVKAPRTEVFSKVNEFTGGAPPDDDGTLMSLTLEI
jgi:hypothetical protein